MIQQLWIWFGGVSIFGFMSEKALNVELVTTDDDVKPIVGKNNHNTTTKQPPLGLIRIPMDEPAA